MSEENKNLTNENEEVKENITSAPQENVMTKPKTEQEESTTPEITEPMPKKSKAPVIGGVIAAAVVVAVAGAAVVNSNPKTVLKKAFTATGTAIAQRESVFKSVSSPEMAKMLADGSYTMTQDITVKNLTDGEDLNGLGVNMAMNVDNTTKQADFTFKGNYKGVNLDILNAYTDNEVILLKLPMLCESTFSVATEDILGQIKASPVFSGYLEDSDTSEDISLKLFDKADIDEESKEVAEIYFKNLDVLSKEIKYTKADAADIELADGSKKCKGYNVQIPSAAATKFFADTVNEVYACEYVQAQLKETAAVSYVAEGYSSPDEYIKDYKSKIDELTAKTTIGDVDATFYINNGLIADSSINSDITYDGNTAKLTLNGGLDTDNSMDLSVNAFNSANEKLVLAYNDSVTNEDTLKESYALSFGDDTSTATLKFNSDYNSADGKVKALFDVNSYGTSVASVDFDGNVSKTDNGMKLNLESINLKNGDESLGEFGYTLNIDKLEGAVQKPEGEPVKILEISESEFEGIYSEIQNGLLGVITQFN